MTAENRMNPTYFSVDEDQWAATDPGRNLAVTAGAGSGKTRVLTTRYIRLLMEHMDLSPDQIAAVTFTEKAALEMKDRIRKLMEKEIRQAEHREAMLRWQNFRDRIGTAPIGTMHSFCSRLLRENFYRIGLAPDFQVLNDGEQKTILADCADGALDRFLSDPQHKDAVRELVQMESADGLINGTLSALLRALYGKMRELGMDAAAAKEATRRKHPDGNLSGFEEALSTMIVMLDEDYRIWKNRYNRLDFSDLELLTVRLLQDPDVRSQVRQRYRFVMMDEFQDTNPLQKEILYGLVGDGQGLEDNRLFVVGDSKQSIYGFRGTDYRIFTQVCADMEEDAVRSLSVCFRSTETLIQAVNHIFSQRMDPYDPLQPSADHRDQGGDPVEFIVCPAQPGGDPRSKAVGELAKLLQNGDTDHELIQRLRELDAMDSVTENDDLEAQVLAARIRQLHRNGVPYGDMAILLRTRYPLPNIEFALRRDRIPYCVLGGTGFSQRQEIKDLLNVYKAVTDSEDAVARMAALRSPFFALSDPDLFCLAQALDHGDDPGDGASTEAKMDSSKENFVAEAWSIFKSLRQKSTADSALGILKRMDQELFCTEILLGQENGAQKVRNLEQLMEMAAEFDGAHLFHPRQFPRYLAEMTNGQRGGSEAALDTEDSDAVKILTIHGAKGLEFDTVLVPGVGRSLISDSRSDPKALFHPHWGITVQEADEEKSSDSLFRTVLTEQKAKELEEAFRVMYVAATRAEKRLIFVGTEKKSSAGTDSFLDVLKSAADADPVSSAWMIEKTAGQVLEDRVQEDDESCSAADTVSVAQQIQNAADRIGWTWQGLLPLQSSISQYRMFRECPRRYYLSARMGLQGSMIPSSQHTLDQPEGGDPLDAALRGTMIHQIISSLEEDPTRTAEELLHRQIQSMEWEGSSYDVSRVLESLFVYLKHYEALQADFNQLYGGTIVERLSEFPFRIPLERGGPVVLTGVVDRLIAAESNGELTAHIVDFKTNRIRSEADVLAAVDAYYPQLLLYRHAVMHLYSYRGKKPTRCRSSLWLLDVGRSVEMPDDPQREKSQWDDWKEAFMYMAGHSSMNDYPPCLGSWCGYCMHRGGCRP